MCPANIGGELVEVLSGPRQDHHGDVVAPVRQPIGKGDEDPLRAAAGERPDDEGDPHAFHQARVLPAIHRPACLATAAKTSPG